MWGTIAVSRPADALGSAGLVRDTTRSVNNITFL